MAQGKVGRLRHTLCSESRMSILVGSGLVPLMWALSVRGAHTWNWTHSNFSRNPHLMYTVGVWRRNERYLVVCVHNVASSHGTKCCIALWHKDSKLSWCSMHHVVRLLSIGLGVTCMLYCGWWVLRSRWAGKGNWVFSAHQTKSSGHIKGIYI